MNQEQHEEAQHPALAIIPATPPAPTSTLGTDGVDQSLPYLASPALTQSPAPYASTPPRPGDATPASPDPPPMAPAHMISIPPP